MSSKLFRIALAVLSVFVFYSVASAANFPDALVVSPKNGDYESYQNWKFYSEPDSKAATDSYESLFGDGCELFVDNTPITNKDKSRWYRVVYYWP
jgi:hypothetical protein